MVLYHPDDKSKVSCLVKNNLPLTQFCDSAQNGFPDERLKKNLYVPTSQICSDINSLVPITAETIFNQ